MSVIFPYAVGAGEWTDHQTYLDGSGVEWLTEIGAAERFNVPRTVLRRYQDRIEHQFIRPPIVRADNTVRVFVVSSTDASGSRESLRQFAERYHASAKSKTRAKGKTTSPTLTKAEAMEEYNIPTKMFFSYWSGKTTRRRGDGEPALRTVQSEFNPHKGQGLRSRIRYNREDIEAILAGEESEHPRVGRPCRPRPGARTNNDALRIVLKFLQDKAPVLRAEVYSFAREQKISHSQLLWCRRELMAQKGKRKLHCETVGGGANKVCYWCLGKQKPSRLEHAPVLRCAVEFLQRALANGKEHHRQDILAAAEAEGVSPSELQTARRLLRIGSNRPRPHFEDRYATWQLRGGHKEQTVTAPNGQAAPVTEPESLPKRRGRKRLERTSEIGEFCYQQLACEVKRRVICNMVAERFNRVMTEPDVTIYARRYATDNGKTWPV
jgi:hypothetical protein